jgi:hypothetical protein
MGRRLCYAELRERAWNTGLPWDEEAERGAIGALLLAPREHAVKLARRARGHYFLLKPHGWLWGRLTYAITQKRLDIGDNGDFQYWAARERIVRKFRQRYHQSIVPIAERCLEAGMWWHGPWYIQRVIEAAKARIRIVQSAEHFKQAIDAAERWIE